MKGQAVTSKAQHQRKEARRKENEMPTKPNREGDWQTPRRWRAAIYLRAPRLGETNRVGDVPSIDYQRWRCRYAATVLGVDVIGEFVDPPGASASRPALWRILEPAYQVQRLDYLVVSSLDRLASDRDEAFEIAWRLGFAGTIVIYTDTEDDLPWAGTTPASRD
jgi:hypothetical protein